MAGRSLNPTILEEAGAALSMGGLLLFSPFLRPWYSTWGLTADEARRHLPGDDIVTEPMLQVTRAIRIKAPPEKIWPWLVQIGYGRAALYSYERLENLARCQMENADRIVPEWQNPQVGENIRLGPKGYPLFQIVSIDPGKTLIMQGCDPVKEMPGPASWTFGLEPLDAHTTRLWTRSRNGSERTFGNLVLWRFLVEPIHFIMERRMLIGIKQRAEAA